MTRISEPAGIDAVTSLIELTFNGFSALSNGAITLLMTPTLLPSITTASAQAVRLLSFLLFASYVLPFATGVLPCLTALGCLTPWRVHSQFL